MSGSSDHSPLLTSRQFAGRVGVTDETVRRWVRAGRLRPYGRTPTGQMRFAESQVAEVLSVPDSKPTERAQDLEAHVSAARERARALASRLQ